MLKFNISKAKYQTKLVNKKILFSKSPIVESLDLDKLIEQNLSKELNQLKVSIESYNLVKDSKKLNLTSYSLIKNSLNYHDLDIKTVGLESNDKELKTIALEGIASSIKNIIDKIGNFFKALFKVAMDSFKKSEDKVNENKEKLKDGIVKFNKVISLITPEIRKSAYGKIDEIKAYVNNLDKNSNEYKSIIKNISIKLNLTSTDMYDIIHTYKKIHDQLESFEDTIINKYINPYIKTTSISESDMKKNLIEINKLINSVRSNFYRKQKINPANLNKDVKDKFIDGMISTNSSMLILYKDNIKLLNNNLPLESLTYTYSKSIYNDDNDIKHFNKWFTLPQVKDYEKNFLDSNRYNEMDDYFNKVCDAGDKKISEKITILNDTLTENIDNYVSSWDGDSDFEERIKEDNNSNIKDFVTYIVKVSLSYYKVISEIRENFSWYCLEYNYRGIDMTKLIYRDVMKENNIKDIDF